MIENYSNIATLTMLRPAFDIISEEYSALIGECSLLIEVNEKQLTFAWIHPREKLITKLKQYHAAMYPDESVLDLLRELLATDEFVGLEDINCCIIYNFAECALVPASHHNIEINKALTELSFGNLQKNLVLSDKVDSWDIYAVYRVPREVHSALQTKFRSGKYWHFNSLLLLGVDRTSINAVEMRLYFYPDKFIVMLLNQDNLLHLQTYFYQVPEDVAFYLLSLCRFHGVKPDEIKLSIAGLIEADSALYYELGRYFLHLDWIESVIPENSNSEYPSHYFSPLVEMSACV